MGTIMGIRHTKPNALRGSKPGFLRGSKPGLLQASKPGLQQDSKPKGHTLSTYKCGYDQAGRTELVKQDMVKEELVNSHDLLRLDQ
ncbi:hypothetical protein Tco_0265269 [Tanacetum coccineum]